MNILDELTIKKAKYIHYINHGHQANLDTICNQEGINLMAAKKEFDATLQSLNNEYEKHV